VSVALVRHTGGNPLFMLETLKQGLTDGSLARGELPRPAGVGALIERRLHRLSEAALALARVAAVAGIDFRIELAEATLGLRAVQLAGAWSELQDAQVLRDEGFAHDLVHEAVLRGVPQPVARRLHADVATFLQSQPSSSGIGGDGARLAQHWEAAGRWAEAKDSLLAAATAARATGRYLEQAALLQRAAAACERAGDRKARFEMLLERVEALAICDDGQIALEAAADLELQAQSDGERLHAIACHANLRGQRMDTEAALELGERGLLLAQRIGDHSARLQLCCTLAYVLSVVRRSAEALERLESVRDWVHSQGTPTDRQHWTTHMALVSTALSRLREAVRLHEVSAALAQELNLLPELTMDYSNMADAYAAMGLPGQAVQAGQRAVQLSRQTGGGSGMVARNELSLAMSLRDACRYEDALALFERWQANAQHEASAVWRGAAQVWWAGLWVQLGQHARALQLLRDEVGHGLNRIRSLGWLYRSQAERATSQPWQASLERAGELYDELQSSGLSQRLARLPLLEPTRALEQARSVGGLAREVERTGTLIHARVREAEAAARLGLRAEARSAAQDALHWLAEGYAPDAVLGHGEAYWLAHEALLSVGEAEASGRTLRLGLQWLREQALPHVPAAFVDSFLHRNPAHRKLLAASGAASA
jgi:tetratricopeptide (TPR) repeat protein